MGCLIRKVEFRGANGRVPRQQAGGEEGGARKASEGVRSALK